jgi:hypothetical protein
MYVLRLLEPSSSWDIDYQISSELSSWTIPSICA